MKAITCTTLAAALALAGCATTAEMGDTREVGTTSNTVRGAAAASAPGGIAIGAYGATSTSDDVRGRTSSSGASPLTGRATMAGNDAGTDKDGADDEDDPPR